MADTLKVDGCPVSETLGYPSVESCGFLWLFDANRNRFRRVPRGVAPELVGAPDEWVRYHRVELQVDRSCFVVTLDVDGTRVLRSWLHFDPCAHCDPAVPGVAPGRAIESLGIEADPAFGGLFDGDGEGGEHSPRLRPYGGRRPAGSEEESS